ncbi:hypothetical protein [Hymenobacter volaticus]|uniref:Uncharacterized protein n=1 Tax=Hymenobacter volaticus TaxID=2932254 RepID=A0ABY4G776_9BACT|nr:hypothetical protein [Hymenobacter volaticus]UOQ66620.1 hypothetical protein MUN86_01425 [Hymenobacter volaticus]
MKKTFLFGLLAASLMLSATSCSNPDFTRGEEMATKPLPPSRLLPTPQAVKPLKTRLPASLPRLMLPKTSRRCSR